MIMRKYLIRYLIFWLPAMLIAQFLNREAMFFQVLLWFSAFFMLFGWSVNTGMAAYNYPRSTLAALLTYTGFNILVVTFIYMSDYRSGLNAVMRSVGGLFSFRPLDIFLQTLKPITTGSIPWEFVIVAMVVVCCGIGFLVGIIHRRVQPNPYRPKIRRT